MSKGIFRLVAASLLAAAWARAEVEVDRKPISMGTAIELGQIVQGRVQEKDNDINGAFVQRLSIFINQQATVNHRLAIDIGVGGLFWYAYPIVANAPWSVTTKFGPGISSAQAVYRFGDPDRSRASLQFGFFPIKYNPDARNLGEYLFRSGVYPAYLWTGGWWNVNYAFYFAQGAHFAWDTFGGMARHDFYLLMERDFAPMGDITPAYMLTLNSGGALEFGAGAAFHHLIPVQPSKTTPQGLSNRMVAVPRQFKPAGDSVYVPVTPGESRQGDTLKFVRVRGDRKDTVYEYRGPGVGLDGFLLREIEANSPGRILYSAGDPYSIQGLKLMARASVDFAKLLGLGAFGPGGLRAFAEAALLGVKDYDFFYESPLERMPLMFGLSASVPKVLDVLALQAEYYRNPFPNSIEALYQFQLPQPGIRTGSPLSFVPNGEDDWKWSLYAARTVFPNLTLFGQVARDHMRTIDHDAKFAYEDVLASRGDWYYMFRIEFGI